MIIIKFLFTDTTGRKGHCLEVKHIKKIHIKDANKTMILVNTKQVYDWTNDVFGRIRDEQDFEYLGRSFKYKDLQETEKYEEFYDFYWDEANHNIHENNIINSVRIYEEK